MKCFIADDDADARTSAGNLVRSLGHEAVCFESAEELLGRLKEEAPDIVVTDHRMPGMKGIELLKTLRGHPLFKDIPVVVISGDDIGGIVRHARGIFARKPDLQPALKAAIAQAQSRT